MKEVAFFNDVIKVQSETIVLSIPNEITFSSSGGTDIGITSRTVVPSVALNGGAFSFSAWVKNADPTRNWNRIFDLGTGEDENNIILHWYDSEGTMQYDVCHGSQNSIGTIKTVEVFPTDRWVLVQLIHRADETAEIYWDGVKKISGSIPLPLPVTGRIWYLGKSHWSSNELFQGAMKEVAFYNGEADIKNLPSYVHDPSKKYWSINQVTVQTCSMLGCGTTTTTSNTTPPCLPSSIIFENECFVFECPSGQFHRTPTECQNMTTATCPAGIGFHSPSAMNSVTLKGSTSNDGSCTSCVPGQYKNTSTPTACLSCPSGYYTVQSTSLSCKACPKGFYATATANQTCDACPIGTYNDQTTSTTSDECTVCAPGAYQNASGSDECKLCPVGKTLTTAETAEYHDELKDCEDCGILQFNPFEGHAEACYLCLTAKNEGASQCDGCDPGKFKVTINSTDECKKCESGYYSIKQNVKVCSKCPLGYFANHQVLAGETQPRYDRCEACPRGTFGIATGANNASEGCSNCTSGKYSEVTGISKANLCKGCPQGKWRLFYFCLNGLLLVSMLK